MISPLNQCPGSSREPVRPHLRPCWLSLDYSASLPVDHAMHNAEELSSSRMRTYPTRTLSVRPSRHARPIASLLVI
jgi:hypothetical protein